MRFLLNVTAIYRHPLNRDKRREFRRRRRDHLVAEERIAPPPHAVIEQITQQARHDLAILAPGALALPYLRQFDAADLFARDGVDAIRLIGAVGARPKTVLVAPWLVVGGAENYAADLLQAILSAGGGPALVVLTDQTAREAGNWEELARLASFRAAQLLFWRDFCKPDTARNVVTFGRFLNLLRAERNHYRQQPCWPRRRSHVRPRTVAKRRLVLRLFQHQREGARRPLRRALPASHGALRPHIDGQRADGGDDATSSRRPARPRGGGAAAKDSQGPRRRVCFPPRCATGPYSQRGAGAALGLDIAKSSG